MPKKKFQDPCDSVTSYKQTYAPCRARNCAVILTAITYFKIINFWQCSKQLSGCLGIVEIWAYIKNKI